MNLAHKLRAFVGEDLNPDVFSVDVCEKDAKLRVEPKCVGKNDFVNGTITTTPA